MFLHQHVMFVHRTRAHVDMRGAEVAQCLSFQRWTVGQCYFYTYFSVYCVGISMCLHPCQHFLCIFLLVTCISFYNVCLLWFRLLEHFRFNHKRVLDINMDSNFRVQGSSKRGIFNVLISTLLFGFMMLSCDPPPSFHFCRRISVLSSTTSRYRIKKIVFFKTFFSCFYYFWAQSMLYVWVEVTSPSFIMPS